MGYLNLLLKIPLYRYAHWKNSGIIKPISYTLSITPHCNSRCKTCNIWQQEENQKKGKILSIQEWQKILHSMGKSPFWVTLSGGEPFLYQDIVPLIEYICRYNRPNIITIPTNCILGESILPTVEKILAITKRQGVKFVINLSLDGIGKDHDDIRGIPGNFERFETVYKRLSRLQKDNPHFTIGIHTVISRFNQDKISEIAHYVYETLQPDSYITEIAENRVELHNEHAQIAPDRYRFLEDSFELIQELEKREKKRGLQKVISRFRIKYYRYVMRYLLGQDTNVSCYAGLGSCQINYNGDVWPCCIKCHSMGNLREKNYNFDKVYNSPAAMMIRHDIKQSGCKCTLANVNYTNMIFNMKIKENIAYER